MNEDERRMLGFVEGPIVMGHSGPELTLLERDLKSYFNRLGLKLIRMGSVRAVEFGKYTDANEMMQVTWEKLVSRAKNQEADIVYDIDFDFPNILRRGNPEGEIIGMNARAYLGKLEDRAKRKQENE